MAGPPFERYPGPPADWGDTYRVISPTRDALAWVANAGKLALVRFLVREGDGWRTLVDDAPEGGDGTPWTFVQRDPVELVFRAGELTAWVTVSTAGCEVRLEGPSPPGGLSSVIEPGAWLTVTASRDKS